jgi:multimeric flavodoxin WrbA
LAEAVAEGLRSAGCQVDLFDTNDGRFDITQFPQYDCAAFGSPDYYSYIAGGLKTFMDDHYIHDVRKGLNRTSHTEETLLLASTVRCPWSWGANDLNASV